MSNSSFQPHACIWLPFSAFLSFTMISTSSVVINSFCTFMYLCHISVCVVTSLAVQYELHSLQCFYFLKCFITSFIACLLLSYSFLSHLTSQHGMMFETSLKNMFVYVIFKCFMRCLLSPPFQTFRARCLTEFFSLWTLRTCHWLASWWSFSCDSWKTNFKWCICVIFSL